jgi:hypothetical protein
MPVAFVVVIVIDSLVFVDLVHVHGGEIDSQQLRYTTRLIYNG